MKFTYNGYRYSKKGVISVSFGKILKSLREDRDLNQEDIAKYMNVDRSTVGKWESGPSKPDYEKLVKLADFFNVTTDYLLGNSKTSTAHNDSLEEEFPEGVYVLRRASKELAPEAKKQMVKIMKTFLEEDDD